MKQEETSVFVRLIRPWLFPLGVGCLYGIGLLYAPEQAGRALHISGSMFGQLALPICIAVVMMVLLNRFLSHALVARFLSTGVGLKGLLLSSLAGILSMGPVYAWYPLFKSLRDKGASVFIVANFIGCRAVKPALFPVLFASFGWEFASVFVLMSLVGAMITACVVAWLCPSTFGADGSDS